MKPSTSHVGTIEEARDAGRPASLADQSRSAPNRFRVLVVDDSALMRRLVTRILETDTRLEIVGSSRNIADALSRIEHYRPDLVMVDVEVSSGDDGSALAALRELYPHVRTVAFQDIDDRYARIMMEELFKANGSPVASHGFTSTVGCNGAHFAEDLLRRVWTAIMQIEQRIAPANWQATRALQTAKPRSNESLSSIPVARPEANSYPQALTIGSSTGGPVALNEVLSALPANFPLPILIVQHMPPHFTKMLADRLAKSCRLPVLEAEHGMVVEAGRAYVAPGDFHMQVLRNVNRVEVRLSKGDPENSCRPAVDVLFRSVAETYHRYSIAVVLTGMGQDGLRGVRALKAKGVPVLVQNRETSVVWGMPGAIAEAGLADHILPVTEIVPTIMGLL